MGILDIVVSEMTQFKVERMKITLLVLEFFFVNAQCGTIQFFEGNSASQDLVCTLQWNNGYKEWNFKSKSNGCQNDEARSAVILYAKEGDILTLYDNPDGKKNDDWVRLKVKEDINEALVIPTFETTPPRTPKTYTGRNGGKVTVSYTRKNGLDGKVSRFEAETD